MSSRDRGKRPALCAGRLRARDWPILLLVAAMLAFLTLLLVEPTVGRGGR